MLRRLCLLSCPLLSSLLLAACGGVPVPDGVQEYRLSAGASAPALVTVTDMRSAADLGPAREAGGHRTNDRLLSPHPADFLAAELSRTLAASTDRAALEHFIGGRPLVLRRFAVLEVGYDRQRPHVDGVPAGQEAVGSLLTLFVDTMSGTKEVRIDVVAELGGREIYCQSSGSARAAPSTDATLAPAAGCVEQLIDDLRIQMKQAEANAAPASAASAPAS
jgi:hypothetical protein